jgi:hypothetical protein
MMTIEGIQARRKKAAEELKAFYATQPPAVDIFDPNIPLFGLYADDHVRHSQEYPDHDYFHGDDCAFIEDETPEQKHGQEVLNHEEDDR